MAGVYKFSNKLKSVYQYKKGLQPLVYSSFQIFSSGCILDFLPQLRCGRMLTGHRLA